MSLMDKRAIKVPKRRISNRPPIGAPNPFSGFSFNPTGTNTESASPFSAGSQNNADFGFGATSSGMSSLNSASPPFGTSTASNAFTFGSNQTGTSSTFSFGNQTNPSVVNAGFGASEMDTSPVVKRSNSSAFSGFGSQGAQSNTGATFNPQFSFGAGNGFSFGGAGAGTGASKPFAFGSAAAETPANGTSTQFSFGSTAAAPANEPSKPFTFGVAAALPKPAESAKPFSFGSAPAPSANATDSTKPFSFGSSTSPEPNTAVNETAKPFGFGSTAATTTSGALADPANANPNGFTFGATTPSTTAAATTEALKPFSFGSNTSSVTSAAPAEASKAFSFGTTPVTTATDALPNTANATSNGFTFGATTPSTTATTTEALKPFAFGSSTSAVTNTIPSDPKKAFSFGTTAEGAASGVKPFGFGSGPAMTSKPIDEPVKEAPKPFSFGSSSVAETAMPKPAEALQDTAKPFSFSSAPVASLQTDAPKDAAKPFSFGATASKQTVTEKESSKSLVPESTPANSTDTSAGSKAANPFSFVVAPSTSLNAKSANETSKVKPSFSFGHKDATASENTVLPADSAAKTGSFAVAPTFSFGHVSKPSETLSNGKRTEVESAKIAGSEQSKAENLLPNIKAPEQEANSDGHVASPFTFRAEPSSRKRNADDSDNALERRPEAVKLFSFGVSSGQAPFSFETKPSAKLDAAPVSAAPQFSFGAKASQDVKPEPALFTSFKKPDAAGSQKRSRNDDGDAAQVPEKKEKRETVQPDVAEAMDTSEVVAKPGFHFHVSGGNSKIEYGTPSFKFGKEGAPKTDFGLVPPSKLKQTKNQLLYLNTMFSDSIMELRLDNRLSDMRKACQQYIEIFEMLVPQSDQSRLAEKASGSTAMLDSVAEAKTMSLPLQPPPTMIAPAIGAKAQSVPTGSSSFASETAVAPRPSGFSFKVSAPVENVLIDSKNDQINTASAIPTIGASASEPSKLFGFSVNSANVVKQAEQSAAEEESAVDEDGGDGAENDAAPTIAFAGSNAGEEDETALVEQKAIAFVRASTQEGGELRWIRTCVGLLKVNKNNKTSKLRFLMRHPITATPILNVPVHQGMAIRLIEGDQKNGKRTAMLTLKGLSSIPAEAQRQEMVTYMVKVGDISVAEKIKQIVESL